MKQNYEFYTAKDLLLDNTFLCWQLFSSDTDREYWEKMLKESPNLEKEVKKASAILKTMKLNKRKLSPDEKDSILQLVQENIRKREKTRKIYVYLSGAACACIALFMIFIAIPELRSGKEDSIALLTDDTTDEKDIQLILSDAEVMTFTQNADIQYKKDGNIIASSHSQKAITKKIEAVANSFNKLIVPHGKRSFLTLEDGTKVWVNSGTSLKFPPTFDMDKREIHVDGEIYIEVEKNPEKPFIVNTSKMRIEVLGTCFNVSSYDEDSFQAIVLVEGAVEVETRDEKIALSPDRMLTIGEEIKVQEVNVYNHISWKDGLLQYSGESLARILTKLSRYYNIPISYENEIENMNCTGKLVLFEDLSDVMESIYNAVSIKYKWENETLHVEMRK